MALKLTSVKVADNLFQDFKISSIRHKFNLQKLVNRSLDLYVKDEKFRDTINNYTDLAVSGSKY